MRDREALRRVLAIYGKVSIGYGKSSRSTANRQDPPSLIFDSAADAGIPENFCRFTSGTRKSATLFRNLRQSLQICHAVRGSPEIRPAARLMREIRDPLRKRRRSNLRLRGGSSGSAAHPAESRTDSGDLRKSFEKRAPDRQDARRLFRISGCLRSLTASSGDLSRILRISGGSPRSATKIREDPRSARRSTATTSRDLQRIL